MTTTTTTRSHSSSNTCTHVQRLKDLVLIRHGESEGNVARNRSIRGDHRLFKGT